MRRIAVMSDTHWSKWDPNDLLVQALCEKLKTGYHQIWHGGDVVDNSILLALEKFCPVICVKGNCDSFFGRDLPHSVVEKIEDVKIGMIHGWNLPLDFHPSIIEQFPDDVKVIIHGHTHRRRFQECQREDGSEVTIINPGSVSSPRGGETPSFGELVIHEAYWEFSVIELA